MKRIAWTMMAVIALFGWNPLLGQSKVPKVIAEFDGASLKWIRAAEPEFQRRGLDLDKYTIIVAEQNDSVVVALKSRDSVQGARGSTGTHPGYEVEISKKDLRVVRSNYVR